jgi:hypothetical protein
MSNEQGAIAGKMHAWASVNAAGAIINSRWVAAAALPGGGGSGIYTVTLDVALDANELMVMLTPHTTATSAIGRLTNTSDTIKTITFIDDAGAAVDTAFYIAFWQVAWGGH